MEEKELINDGESPLTMKDVFKALKKKTLVIVILLVAFLAVGAMAGYFVVQTEHSAKASLIVTVESSKTSYVITTPDGKIYTVDSDKDLDAEMKADGYAKTLASNYNALLNTDNEAVFRLAIEKYKTTYGSKQVENLKPEDFTTTFSSYVNGSTLVLSFTSTMEDPENMLKCVIDAFVETVGDKDGGKNIFGITGGKISVLSAPEKIEGSVVSKIIKYSVLFFVIGIAVSVCVVVISAVGEKRKFVNKK